MSHLHPIQIGNFTLPENCVLAPMAGVTDQPFRRLCREMGAALVYTEMVSGKGLMYGGDRTRELLALHPQEHPVGIQLFGSDPDILGQIASDLRGTPAALLDINMGCPAPKITSNGEGSALMRNIPLAARVIAAVVRHAKQPVTVKFRKGWDEHNINAVAFAKMAQEQGAAAVTVHGRTRMQQYSGNADWDIIAEVKQAVRIPVFGNGDIRTGQDALRMFQHTGCDGIMVARGAQGNPWIFQEIRAALYGQAYEPPTPLQRLDMAMRHLEMQVAYKGERIGVREMRTHIAHYVKGLRGAAVLRDEINHIVELAGVLDKLRTFGDQLEQ